MKRVLITGGTGFIGTNLIKKMVGMNIEINVVIRKTSNLDNLAGLRDIIKLHIYDEDISSMIKIMEASSPDIVIHLASLFIAEHSSDEVDDLIKSNILFGTHLLEAMKINGVNHLINTGTNWQNYSGSEYNPMDLYAATKEAFENIARFYSESSPIKMITLKLYDTYGPNDKRNKIFNLFKRISISGENLDMSPGEQLLGLVYIDDVVEAFICAMRLLQNSDLKNQHVYFVNPDKFISLKEVVSIYEEILGLKLNINWGARSYRVREIMNPYIGQRLPNWRPKVDLYRGIDYLVKYF